MGSLTYRATLVGGFVAVVSLFWTGERLAAQGLAEGSRQWSDNTGSYRVEATFLGINEDKVVLETPAGKRIKVPLDRLSSEDVEYALRAVARAAAGFSASGTPAPPAALPGTVQLRTGKSQWGMATTVSPKQFPEWKFQPNSTRGGSDKPGKPRSIALAAIENSKPFFENARLFLDNNEARAFLVRKHGQVGSNKEYVEPVDLVAGKSTGLVGLPGGVRVLDAFPAERLIAYVPGGFHDGDELTVATVDQGRITPIVRWTPYEGERSKYIDHLWFLGRDRIMTSRRHGKALTIWEPSTFKVLANIPIGFGGNVRTALSADRQYVAITMESGIAIIDLKAGEHVATVATGKQDYVRLAFSEDNRHLVGLCKPGIFLWDLTSGKLVRQFWHPTMGKARRDLSWAGGFVVLANQYVYDVPRRILLWEYETDRSLMATQQCGARLWAVLRPTEQRGPARLPTERGQARLMAFPMPHDEVLTLAHSLGTSEDLLEVKPGDPVALEVEVDPGSASEAELRGLLTEKLQAAGLKVVDDADLVVKAVCKRKEKQTIKIDKRPNQDPHHFSPGFPYRAPDPKDIITKTITPHESSVSMQLHGKTIWLRGYLAKPGQTIRLKPEETIDQALHRLTQPNLDVIKQAYFTAFIAKPGNATPNGAYGTSKLGPTGGTGGRTSGARFE
jgi:WD40 repeat protein